MSSGLKEFMDRMRHHESAGNGGYQAINPSGYIGGYQFGEQELAELGWIVDHDLDDGLDDDDY
jgi:hypothetical protein